MPRDTVLTQVQRPELSKPGRESVTKFREEYEEYTRLIEAYNVDRPANSRLRRSTIRECVTVDLLENLIMTNLIEGCEDINELTDEHVKQWYDSVLDKEPQNLGDKVAEAIRKHKHTPNPNDPEAGVQEFVFSVMSDLRALGGAKFMKDKSQAKSVISRLANALKPKELKELLLRDKSMWKDQEHSSISHFLTRAGDIATQVQRIEELKARHDPNDQSRKRRRERDPPTNSASDDRQKVRPKKLGKWKPGDKWLRPCLNPDCPDMHRIEDCPRTPEPDKKRLLDEHIARLKEKRKSAKSAKSAMSPECEDELDVFVSGISARAREDTGADTTIIPATLLTEIQKRFPDAEVRELNDPMRLELAVQGDNIPHIEAKRELYAPMTIIIPGSRLPVIVRNVRMLVAEMPMRTILLGRDLLDYLGFNFVEYLRRNYRRLGELPPRKDGMRAETARVNYAGVTYGDKNDDPIEMPVDLSDQFGDDKPDEVESALEERVTEAEQRGLSKKGAARLREILKRRRSVFGIKLGTSPPAKIRPFEVQMKEGARPFRATQRRYGPTQQAFIESTIRNLEKIGAVYKNPNAKWASPALAVPKPGTDQLRFTVDLRGVNSLTIVIQSGMPHFESHLQQVSGSRFFCNLDFCHGFWQIPLSEASQEVMSIMTHIGIFSPTRTLQGGADSACYFHDTTREKFSGRVQKLIQWIDDYLLHDDDEDDLLDSLDEFLAVCEENGFRVHAKKSHFFMIEAKFCGRVLADGKVRFDPRNLQGLVDMRTPTRGDELQQLLCASNWMRTSIPSYSELVAPLQALLEKAASGLKKRTKRSLARVDISTDWGEAEATAFDKLKQSLVNATSLSFPKNEHAICLFTDASDDHWSAIFAQCPNSALDTNVKDRPYEPLAFISGSFKSHSAKWSTPEKEGFAIVEAMTRMDYLTLGRLVHIFTDHHNLLTMYDPSGAGTSLPQYAINKLMRWAIRMSSFNYVIEHIPGDDNVWADMLSRWANHEFGGLDASKISAKSALLAPISPSLDEAFEWPSPAELINVQPASSPGPEWTLQNCVWTNKKGEILIPQSEHKLKIRILVAAHAGPAGHRASEATKNNLTGRFWWDDMEHDINSFINSCLHCITSSSGQKVPRPLGHTIHATEPNQVIHFDFCYMGKSTSAHEYVLIIKDDLTSFVWLKPTVSADAVTTADILLEWFSSFGTARTWISDQGRHFLNEVISELRDRTKSKHHFTLPYTPWSNGTVEVVCRELKRVTKAILSEFQLAATNWRSTLPLVQGALNTSPMRRLNNKCPMTLFTGRPQDTPVAAIVTKEHGVTHVHNLDDERRKAVVRTEKLQERLEKMHRDCAEATARRRTQAVKSHNQRTGVRPVNFDTGDFVLRGNPTRGTKLQLTWTGPFRITECRSEYLFEIEDLLTKERSVAHGRRLKLFRNKDFSVTEDVLEHLEYQRGELLVIESFEDIRLEAGRVECLVKWKGFSSEENDWLTAESLSEDVPDLFQEYLEEVSKNGTKRQRDVASRLR